MHVTGTELSTCGHLSLELATRTDDAPRHHDGWDCHICQSRLSSNVVELLTPYRWPQQFEENIAKRKRRQYNR
jgi:hypothetical protein